MKPFLDEQGLVISIDALTAGGKSYPWRQMGESACWVLAICTILCAGCRAHPPLHATTDEIQVSTRVVPRGVSNVVMVVILRNLGSQDLVVPYGYLPWDGDVMSLDLRTTGSPGTPLRREAVIADPVPGPPWRIKAGQRMQGEINLTGAFPDLAEELRRTDVMVLWSYQIAEQRGQEVQAQGREVISKFP